MQRIMVSLAFQVGGHVGPRQEGSLDYLFDAGRSAVRIAQRGAFGKKEMQFHPMSVADVPMSQGVVGDAVPGGFVFENLH